MDRLLGRQPDRHSPAAGARAMGGWCQSVLRRRRTRRKPVRASYRWSEVTESSARWEQAFSADDGQTWETNWVMEWTRRAAEPEDPRLPMPTDDFDFLVGRWKEGYSELIA